MITRRMFFPTAGGLILTCAEPAQAAEEYEKVGRFFFPKARSPAHMSRRSSSYSGQFGHTVAHMSGGAIRSGHRISSSEARSLLRGLTYAEVDGVHECYHSRNASFEAYCLAMLTEWHNPRPVSQPAKPRSFGLF